MDAAETDRSDPVIPFNLGNVLFEQGRQHEAALAYHAALAREPRFPEAWFNLALGAEHRSDPDQAVRYYREALAAWPDYPEAIFALARLLTDSKDFEPAAQLWQRYLALKPRPNRSSLASKYETLCRLELAAQARL